MRKIPIYQVDAFTSELFSGNPAAVCPVQAWLDDDLLQAIAGENNLSETAFIMPGGTNGEDYSLRWFTPTVEVDLCGHATLASAFVIFNKLGHDRDTVSFSSRSGRLEVERGDDGVLSLNFPALPVMPIEPPDGLVDAIGLSPLEYYRERLEFGKSLAVLDSQNQVAALDPDLGFVANMAGDGLIVTAPGDDENCDFVSRYFAPNAGIPEDPVTGSAHCALVPYWADRLDKTVLSARQISRRGGKLQCELNGNRVRIAGRAVLYMEGEIGVP